MSNQESKESTGLLRTFIYGKAAAFAGLCLLIWAIVRLFTQDASWLTLIVPLVVILLCKLFAKSAFDTMMAVSFRRDGPERLHELGADLDDEAKQQVLARLIHQHDPSGRTAEVPLVMLNPMRSGGAIFVFGLSNLMLIAAPVLTGFYIAGSLSWWVPLLCFPLSKSLASWGLGMHVQHEMKMTMLGVVTQLNDEDLGDDRTLKLSMIQQMVSLGATEDQILHAVLQPREGLEGQAEA